jgi:hypothetical protein
VLGLILTCRQARNIFDFSVFVSKCSEAGLATLRSDLTDEVLIVVEREKCVKFGVLLSIDDIINIIIIKLKYTLLVISNSRSVKLYAQPTRISHKKCVRPKMH